MNVFMCVCVCVRVRVCVSDYVCMCVWVSGWVSELACVCMCAWKTFNSSYLKGPKCNVAEEIKTSCIWYNQGIEARYFFFGLIHMA